MKTPYDLAVVPSQTMLGICLDCDRTCSLTTHGHCAVCGSNSIIKKGAIRELRKRLRLRDAREARQRAELRKG